MIAARQIDHFTETDRSLLRAIIYFDIFNYPITAEEAFTFSASSLNAFTYQHSLDKLVAEGLIFQIGNFYSIQNDLQLANERIKGNALAEKKMETARKYSRLVASFPFVRAVMLSGSISKGFMNEESDIDYFIITEAKRLWIVRTALAVFRRLLLFNSHKNLCTNYFIDTANLVIPDQNIFTATEMCTLRPTYGGDAIEKFQAANQWAHTILPQGKFNHEATTNKKYVIKGLIEFLFSFRAVDNLNQWLMNKSILFWKRKYAHVVNTPDFEIAFRSKEGVSKSHPRFFQKRALSQLEQKVRAFEVVHGVSLS
jgi:hypothetical protein